MAPPTSSSQRSSDTQSSRPRNRRRSNRNANISSPPPPSLSTFHLSDISTRSGFSLGTSDILRGVGVGMPVPPPALDDSCAAELARMAADTTGPIVPPEAEGRGAELLRLLVPLLPPDTSPEEMAAISQGVNQVERIAFLIVIPAAPLFLYIWITWMLRLLENGTSLLNRTIIIMLVMTILLVPHYRIALEAWRRYMA